MKVRVNFRTTEQEDIDLFVFLDNRSENRLIGFLMYQERIEIDTIRKC